MAKKKSAKPNKADAERWVLGYDVKWMKNEMNADIHPEYNKVKKEAIKKGVWKKY